MRSQPLGVCKTLLIIKLQLITSYNLLNYLVILQDVNSWICRKNCGVVLESVSSGTQPKKWKKNRIP